LIVWPARMNFLQTVPLKSKKMMSMLLTFLFHLSHHFSVSVSLHFPLRLMLPSPKDYLIFARVSVAIFLRFASSLMRTICRINRIRPDT
jgi:hypothetical protein